MPIYKINTRSSKINSCYLRIDAIKALYKLIDEKVNEALKYELEDSPILKSLPENQIKEHQDRIKQYFKLGVLVKGTMGEYLTGDDISLFDDESFPKNIEEIVFDSSYIFRQMTGQEPRNKIIIQFDFKKQKIFDFSNPASQQDPNTSSINVAGYNDTWVNGVYAQIMNFLKEIKLKRNWLHKRIVYDFYLYLVFYPITFWCIYRVSEFMKGKIGTVLSIGIYLYIFFFILFLLRLLFNYTRWIFPLLEFIPKSGTKMGRHRTILTIILLGTISSLLYDVIKAILKG